MKTVVLVVAFVLCVHGVPAIGQACRTVDFPREPCKFPFIDSFTRDIHYQCTYAGDSPTPWCATRVIPGTDKADETKERGVFKYLRDCDPVTCEVEGDSIVVRPPIERPILGCKEVNVNYAGSDIPRSLTTQLSWELCKKHCQENRRCQNWTFRNADGFCWLKTAINRRNGENGLVSGPSHCQSEGTCSITRPCISEDFACQFGDCIPKTSPEYSCSIINPCYEGSVCQFGKCIPKTSPEYSCSIIDPCYEGATCEFGKCVDRRPTRPDVRPPRPGSFSRKCTFASDCSGEKAKCQRKQCVTPADPNFSCTFASDCYSGLKSKCQDGRCRDPSMRSFKCTFDSDCFDGDDCDRGQCQSNFG